MFIFYNTKIMKLNEFSAINTPDSTLWESIFQDIKKLTPWNEIKDRNIINWSIYDGNKILTMRAYDNKIEKIILTNTVYLESSNDSESHRNTKKIETINIFFSHEKQDIENIAVNTKIGPVSFDNGIKRWPERNSMHLNIELNQLFSKNGEIEIFNKALSERWHVELYIHGAIFQWWNSIDAINSFILYEFIDWQLIPIEKPIEDFTRDRVKIVQEIIEPKIINIISEEKIEQEETWKWLNSSNNFKINKWNTNKNII